MNVQRKVIGIVGSYREHGTVDQVLDDILVAAAAHGALTRKVYLKDHQINFCTNCRQCTQDAGTQRVACRIHHDEMEDILEKVEAADAIVLGAPVNLGGVNAITQRFLERCIGYCHWPWSAAAPRPRCRISRRKAVLVTSSAAPWFMNNRLFGNNALRPLKMFARLLGAHTTRVIRIGFAGRRTPRLSERIRRRSRRIGEALAA